MFAGSTGSDQTEIVSALKYQANSPPSDAAIIASLNNDAACVIDSHRPLSVCPFYVPNVCAACAVLPVKGQCADAPIVIGARVCESQPQPDFLGSTKSLQASCI